MLHPLSSHCHLPGGQQLAIGTMELPVEGSGLHMGSLLPAGRKGTFGIPALPSPESGQSDFRMYALHSLEPKNKPGKYFPRASK